MTQIEIEWTQRVMGRWPGQTETVEKTPLIDGLIKNGRVKVLGAEPVADHVAIFDAPVVNDLGQTFPTDLAGAIQVAKSLDELIDLAPEDTSVEEIVAAFEASQKL